MKRFVIECEFNDYHTPSIVTLVNGTDEWPGLVDASLEIAAHRLTVHGALFDERMQLRLVPVTTIDGAEWMATTTTAPQEGD